MRNKRAILPLLFIFFIMKKFLLSIAFVSAAILLMSCSLFPKYSAEEKKAIIEEATTLVDQKGDWWQALEAYKKLTEIEEPNSENRQRILRYLLDVSLKAVEERRAEDALKMSEALDKVLPNDFYVQNRTLGAYRIMAENAMAKKDWKTAEDILYNKALRLRFDVEVMRTFLKLRLAMAEEALTSKKSEDAKKYLEEVIMISNIDENKNLYQQEKEKAEKLLKRL